MLCRKVFEEHFARRGFALDFECGDLTLPRFDAVEQAAFFLFEGGGTGGADIVGQGVGSKFGLLADEFAALGCGWRCPERARGIDHGCGVRKRGGPVLHQGIKAIVLAHIFEEVFLTPPPEHGGGDPVRRLAVIGRQDGALMAFAVEVAHFAQPQPVKASVRKRLSMP